MVLRAYDESKLQSSKEKRSATSLELTSGEVVSVLVVDARLHRLVHLEHDAVPENCSNNRNTLNNFVEVNLSAEVRLG
jgi:hypothetical protein